ncbi:MAG: T9SS type A sorting domain-containing protein [Ignavibacteriaceae bacterium]|nr:T9SS type A sorting domain-containing protein [Ignavibacteriaceae bacterium]
MRLGKNIVFVTLFFSSILFPQEERKVLVEVFTNSHCPLCPAAHNVIDNYLAGPNGNKISYIYYHMIYPYNDDPLYWESMEGSDARDNYYNPVSATPQGWFDGTHQGSTSGWATTLDNLVNTQSPLKIELSGYTDLVRLFIDADVTRTGDITDNDLVLHFVVAEDVFYDGRNSISNHKNVMRKMLPTPEGLAFDIALNETKGFQQIVDLNPLWDIDSLSVVVFAQSVSSKTIYQSEDISYTDLTVTDVENNNYPLSEFKLDQNYPNPFNPSTVIRYQLPVNGNVSLKVFDLLGREVATLVDEYRAAGKYKTTFNAVELANGVYFYEVRAGSYSETKKMILLK